MSKLFHGISNHNRWIRKGKKCPYCTKGSTAVHESLLEMTDVQIEEYINKRTKEIKTGDFNGEKKA
jgi:glutaredoxin